MPSNKKTWSYVDTQSPIMRKTLFIVLGSITGTILLFMGGCYGLGKYIVSHKTCERFSVDNYELRTHTDIPKKKSTTCHFDTATQTKSSVFVLDLSPKELSASIKHNNLKKVTTTALPRFPHNPQWNDSITQLPIAHLYAKTGQNQHDSWVYVLDSVHQTFWAELTEKE